MSTDYIGVPFVPWWDERKTGPSPTCSICDCLMVRGREALIYGPADCVIGHRDADHGWECMSCGRYEPDPAQPAERGELIPCPTCTPRITPAIARKMADILVEHAEG